VRVLIVKMSSMGDVIHTLPALTDAARMRPELRFDWVIEEAFAEIPAWHPAVQRVIPVALRRWRGGLGQMWRDGEFSAFRRQLQRTHYDLIIDAQGLIKSGLVSRLARGLTVGLSNQTIREPLATLFYNQKYAVARDMHAVQRVRELFARALQYRVGMERVDYGIRESLDDRNRQREAGQESCSAAPTLLFFHGTTWQNKHWPESFWRELAKRSVATGYQVLLPWGSVTERERAHRIAASSPGIAVLPRLTLVDLARELLRVRAVVAVDTGLAHLAAAMDVPAVVLYGPTDPALAGTYGRGQRHLVSTLSCAPCLRRRCHYRGEPQLLLQDGRSAPVQPPCFADHAPSVVFDQLQRLLVEHEEMLT